MDQPDRSDKARFPEAKAAAYLRSVLIAPRDKVVRTWIDGVNPLVNFRLAEDGTLTFENAAVEAKVSTPPSGYAISWSRFDNATDTHTLIRSEETVPSTSARAPQGLDTSEYVAVTVKGHHPDHATWTEPVRAYFRREGAAWNTVGLERP